jgi:hypothetical protein
MPWFGRDSTTAVGFKHSLRVRFLNHSLPSCPPPSAVHSCPQRVLRTMNTYDPVASHHMWTPHDADALPHSAGSPAYTQEHPHNAYIDPNGNTSLRWNSPSHSSHYQPQVVLASSVPARDGYWNTPSSPSVSVEPQHTPFLASYRSQSTSLHSIETGYPPMAKSNTQPSQLDRSRPSPTTLGGQNTQMDANQVTSMVRESVQLVCFSCF